MIETSLKMGAYGAHQYWLHGLIWTPDDECYDKVIHIVYGVTEHMERYREFAEIMTMQGIAVAGFDLRGHGKNEGDSECATFISGQKSNYDFGWSRSVFDLSCQKKIIMEHCKNAKYYLMGVSSGSLLVRDYINEGNMNDVSGIILVGSGQPCNFLSGIMQVLAGGEVMIHQNIGFTQWARNFIFYKYCKYFNLQKFKNDMGWINSDKEEFKKYSSDPNVKKRIAPDLLFEIIRCSRKLSKQKLFECKTNKENIPVLLLSGKNDTFGEMGKGVRSVVKWLKSYDVFSVKSFVIPNARHDLLHEYEGGSFVRALDHMNDWFAIV